MTRKAPVLRAAARQDIDAATDYYVMEAGERIALNFIHAIEEASKLLSDHPQSGAARYAHELNLPGLRGLNLKRFPYVVFYVARGDQIEIWRVLHAVRDIPERLREPDS